MAGIHTIHAEAHIYLVDVFEHRAVHDPAVLVLAHRAAELPMNRLASDEERDSARGSESVTGMLLRAHGCILTCINKTGKMDREHPASATKPMEPTDGSTPQENAADASASVAAVGAPPAQEQSRDWRRWLGRHVGATGQTIDANLTIFRIGCLLTMAGSVVAVMRFSGVFQRFSKVDEIPSWYFSQHKKLCVRMIRQCEDDPSIFYVYHTPFLRRTLLQDTLPRDLLFPKDVIALPFTRDFANEIVANGYGECIPESLSKYDDGTEQSLEPLIKRLKQLEATQKHAQVMQYGIWKDWQEEKLSERVVSAGKRVTARGLQKLYNKIIH
ncbi:hypothetical protein FI667_g14549, partial [Globisporangium splendens]